MVDAKIKTQTTDKQAYGQRNRPVEIQIESDRHIHERDRLSCRQTDKRHRLRDRKH